MPIFSLQGLTQVKALCPALQSPVQMAFHLVRWRPRPIPVLHRSAVPHVDRSGALQQAHRSNAFRFHQVLYEGSQSVKYAVSRFYLRASTWTSRRPDHVRLVLQLSTLPRIRPAASAACVEHLDPGLAGEKCHLARALTKALAKWPCPLLSISHPGGCFISTGRQLKSCPPLRAL